MVRIFCDKNGSGDYVVQTDCLECGVFVSELSEAMSAALSKVKDDSEMVVFGILNNAMPIAFKLSGYKADNVQEERTLACGTVSPENCQVLASAGR